MQLIKTPYGEEITLTKNDNYTVMEVTDEDGITVGICIDTNDLIKAFKLAIKELK